MATSLQPCFQPYEWIGGDIDGYYSVRIWCHDQNSKRVLVHIKDYKILVKIALPTIIADNYGNARPCQWSDLPVMVYYNWLCRALGSDAPISYRFEKFENLYYHTGKKYPYLLCEFNSETAVKHCIALLNKSEYAIHQLGKIRAKVMETGIKNIHKFITSIGIGYTQWFRLREPYFLTPELDKISHNEIEYEASYSSIIPISEEESKNWIVYPLIASIDIEAFSTNERKMPTKTLVDDVVFQISFILKRMYSSETERHLLVLGDCHDIEGVIIHRYSHELRLIDGLCELINQTDPSIIIGYNIFGFDFPYLSMRKKIYHQEWINCGLLRGGITEINDRDWNSKAFGDMTVSEFVAEGRICIDLLPVIRRDYKLGSYSLDSVSRFFLGKGKHDVSAIEMFRIFRMEESDFRKREMARVGRYCIEDSNLCHDLLEKLNIWFMLTEMSNIVSVRIVEVFSNGQQMRVQYQLFQYCHRSCIVMDERGGLNGYKGAHVEDPEPGFYQYDITLDFASLYPSIIISNNICYTTLVPPERTDIPDEMCHSIKCEEEEGKIYTYRFLKKEYKEGILPKMCTNLISRRRATRKLMEYEEEGSLVYILLDKRQLALKISANSIYGALGVGEGRIPLPEGARSITALGRILQKRAGDYVKEKYHGRIVYGDTDSIMVDLGITDPLDCLKYGKILEEEISSLYEKPLRIEYEKGFAMALYITKKKYIGILLATIKDPLLVEEVSFKSEYIIAEHKLFKFVVKGKKGGEETKYLAIPEKHIPPPDAKIFAGIPLGGEGKPNPKDILKRGVLDVRRDNCPWGRRLYSRLATEVMFQRPFETLRELIDDEVRQLIGRSIPLSDYIFTKQVKSNYAIKSSFPFKIFVDQLKLAGIQVSAGERIEHVYVRREGETKDDNQGLKMRTLEQYRERMVVEKLDFAFYIKSLNNPISQLLSLGYPSLPSMPKSGRKKTRDPTIFCRDYMKIWSTLVSKKEALNREFHETIYQVTNSIHK